jgi:7-carboxy-7-deazaguanine synthase
MKQKTETLLLSSDGDRGIFATLQGEGVTVGSRAVFVRLQGCNLRCEFCDTKHTIGSSVGVTKEPIASLAGRITTLWETADWQALSKLPGYKDSKERLVLTGGEPLLQNVSSLLALLPGWQIEIETNGTICPEDKLAGCQINCSPKLKNSGNSFERRYHPDVLRAIAAMPNSTFKFVARDVSDLVEIDGMVGELGVDQATVIIMPEGIRNDVLAARATVLAGPVADRGYLLGQRSHIAWFGNKRGT